MPAKLKKPTITRSLQFRLALGYSLIIAVLLVLMNTYPLIMTQNLMFRSQQTALQRQAVLVTNTLTTADSLTPETVEQSVSPLDLEVSRLVVTDDTGQVLYDTGTEEDGEKYDLTGTVASALRGNDSFYSVYEGNTFRSQAATPVMTWGSVIGAVCLCAEDPGQGTLLHEIQHNLRIISVVVCLAVLALFAAFSGMLTRRVGQLLSGIRTVREGEYTHRVTMKGRDELGQIADEFNQLTRRLQTTEEARRRFVSDASHELKTPLTSIRLLTDSILQDEGMDRGTVAEFAGDIGDAADRLIRISEELLTLNRLDEGGPLRREPVDLNGQIARTLRLLAPLAEEAEVTVTADPGPDCTVLSTPGDMDQIVRNLMENAVKYNVPGGAVTVRTRREGERVVLTVSDTGVGIPEEDRARIFDRFYRVDKARSRAAGGNGLGLSIVKDTVTAHGGSVAVEPNDGPGVTFTVTLPARE